MDLPNSISTAFRAYAGAFSRIRGLSGRLLEPRPWLAPLAPLYGAASRLHGAWMRREGAGRPRPQIPLVVVGSLRAGGSGKTGVTALLARRFAGLGFRVAVLAYRLGPGPGPGAQDGEAAGRGRDPVEVREDGDWRLTSEEAVMLSRITGARVFATRNRARAWRALEAAGPEAGGPFDIILSDDGFQDPRLEGAFRILLAAPGERPGLWDLLPAGPYRETWHARGRADLILAGPCPATREPGPREPGPINTQGTGSGEVTYRFFRRLLLPAGAEDGRPWMALCGLGDNRRFLADLEARGIRPLAALEAPDHGTVPEGRMAALARRHRGAGILCTRKDFLKLEAGQAVRHGIEAVDEEITLEAGAFEAIAASALARLAPEPARSGYAGSGC